MMIAGQSQVLSDGVTVQTCVSWVVNDGVLLLRPLAEA